MSIADHMLMEARRLQARADDAAERLAVLQARADMAADYGMPGPRPDELERARKIATAAQAAAEAAARMARKVA
jgi:hypothetical protein